MIGKDIQFLELDRKNHILYQSCVFHMLAGEELHPSQLPILWTLSRSGPSSQGQIACLLGVSRAAVAVSVKRMERSGLVHREKRPGDQRKNLVTLTPKGEAVARRAQEAPGLYPGGAGPDDGVLRQNESQPGKLPGRAGKRSALLCW